MRGLVLGAHEKLFQRAKNDQKCEHEGEAHEGGPMRGRVLGAHEKLFQRPKAYPSPRDVLEISTIVVPESLPLPLWMLLELLQFSYPKAYPFPVDFIEISTIFVPESLPLPLWILLKVLQLAYP